MCLFIIAIAILMYLSILGIEKICQFMSPAINSIPLKLYLISHSVVMSVMIIVIALNLNAILALGAVYLIVLSIAFTSYVIANFILVLSLLIFLSLRV